MPNWITNKIKAPKHIIEAMLNENSAVDFHRMMPSPLKYGEDWDGIYGDAETAAEKALGIIDGHPLIQSLQIQNQDRSRVQSMSDESFEQFVGMLRNYREHGYLHSMAFARDKWGTKWNACESQVDLEDGTAAFETAWACPKPVLIALSERFPDDEISVVFADEDIGSNCGSFILKSGVMISHDIAPNYNDMTDAEKEKWTAFAYQVKGWKPDPDDED